jgi:ribosomal protein S17E
VQLIDKSDKELRKDFEANKNVVNDKFKEVINMFTDRVDGHEARITKLEEEVKMLIERPIAAPTDDGPQIDYSLFCMKSDYNNLAERVKKVEKRNIEQDDRLTNNELRIEKLEKMISDPLERIMALEQAVAGIHLELNNRVTVQDLYNEMLKKADINGLKALEASLMRLNDHVADLVNQFADRIENDKAHKLLQKNLKNLYDLFMSLKGEGTEDDPMFTTKGLNCASCAKGVINMIGFRADHNPWSNFPFKDPA